MTLTQEDLRSGAVRRLTTSLLARRGRGPVRGLLAEVYTEAAP